jgi:hypothetical protein
MIAAALVVYLVTGTFLDAAYYDLLYFLVAAMVIVKDVVRKNLPAVAPSPVPLELSKPQLNPRPSAGLPA